jgi:hypothetical protein
VTPTPAEPGDANCDGVVTAADVSAVVTQIAAGGQPHCGADANGNGLVEADDIAETIRRIFNAQLE